MFMKPQMSPHKEPKRQEEGELTLKSPRKGVMRTSQMRTYVISTPEVYLCSPCSRILTNVQILYLPEYCVYLQAGAELTKHYFTK